LRIVGCSCFSKVTVSANDRKPDRDTGASGERGDRARENARHPSYDPSGSEPSGNSSGIPGRNFAGEEFAEAESEQARGRRESAATRDTALGPHDQEFSEGTRVSETSDRPIRIDAPPEEQAPRRAGRDREGSEDSRG